MSKPVNLNKVRKARARAETKAQADENAVRFGLTKAEKHAARAETDRKARSLDGAKITSEQVDDPGAST